ncbi:hypothetical protein EZV73_16985 [Acidaminobacter sp. JC074]|uniref:hypothetical protein n=1 Tax=Acidaminobacter sp. JC074 TaxID=2530199 RepID=UPI001F0E12B4|nr:hypothetical protein [Acidaminobacter sp. JC074]MCH4889295.1 hypothetical protein [Acidaminobacter sp. JC074]
MLVTQAYQLSQKIAELFYIGDDQVAWNLVIEFVDVLAKIEAKNSGRLNEVFLDLEKVYVYKESINYPLIADIFMYNIGRHILMLEEA